jgi:energy-converting hydrogenase A subunit R
VRQAFVSDCEGPISKNDNAYEITSQLVSEGSRLYTVISRYDDVLANVLKRPGYKAGSTLKLILPFLKAYCATDQKMQELSARNLVLISDVKATLQHIRSLAPAFIVSTSYEHYIKALCQAIDFPCENTYCTKVNIDKYDMMKQEKNLLRTFAAEIAKMNVIDIPPDAKSARDLSTGDQETIKRLDEIFWKEVSKLEIGRIYSEVDPMGGAEKAEAIEDIVQKLKIRLSNTMYVGDSITDEEAFKLVKKGDGLTVSFNGNQYAVRNAEVAVLSESSIPTAIIADIFCRFGKRQALKLAEDWSVEALKKNRVSPNLLERFFKSQADKSCKVEIVNKGNVEELVRKSTEFRREVRGEAVGGLG